MSRRGVECGMHATTITRHISATAGTAKRFVMARTTSELFSQRSQGKTIEGHYRQLMMPSSTAGGSAGALPWKIAQVKDETAGLHAVADQPDAVADTIVIVTPGDGTMDISDSTDVYVSFSNMKPSSVPLKFRRSVLRLASFALPLRFWNFGMAIAARTPMITMTISSSMRVKAGRGVRIGR